MDNLRQKLYSKLPGVESGIPKHPTPQGPPSRAALGLPLHSSGYPTVKLLNRLAQENANIKLLKRLSTPLQTLASMCGEELVNFFHNHVATIGRDGEELQVGKLIIFMTICPNMISASEIIANSVNRLKTATVKNVTCSLGPKCYS